MGGLTNNTDILKGINQIIAAINALELSASCPAPEVAVTVRPNITVNCSCSGSAPTLPPPPDDLSETSPDPPGWEAKPVNDDACKRANINYDALYSVVEKFNENNVPGLATIAFATAMAAMSILFGEIVIGTITLTIMIPAFDVLGYAETVLKALINPEVNLSTILLKLQNNKQAIVCDFYSKIQDGSASTDALSGLLAILEADGLSAANRGAVTAIYGGAFVTSLFKTTPGLEAALDGYTGSVDCGGCNPAEEWFYAIWEHGTVVSLDGDTLIVDSTLNNGYAYASVQMSQTQNVSVSCNATLTEADSFRAWLAYPAELVYSDDTPPQDQDMRLLIVAAQVAVQSFRLTITHNP